MLERVVRSRYGDGGEDGDCGDGSGYDGLFATDEAIELYTERAEDPELFPEIDFRVGSATDTPFDSDAFDYAVFSFFGPDYLHPESERTAALRELRRVLKPGGRLLFSTPTAGIRWSRSPHGTCCRVAATWSTCTGGRRTSGGFARGTGSRACHWARS